MAFNIPTYRFNRAPVPQGSIGAIWTFHTSPAIPIGSWGGTPARGIPTANGYEWWALYEFMIDPTWNSSADQAMFVFPFEAHASGPEEPAWGTVSPMHVIYRGGNLRLQHQPNSPNHEWIMFSNLTKGVWHSLVCRFIFGRLDGSVSASGHPNGGMGRTRAWLNGNDTPFDTGNINNITRDQNGPGGATRLDYKLVILEGTYSGTMADTHIASFTAGRWGNTLSEALTDSSIVKTGDQGVGGSNTLTVITSRTDTDFVLPPSLGGGTTPPPTPTNIGPWADSVQYNSADDPVDPPEEPQEPPTVVEQHIGPWTDEIEYNSVSSLPVLSPCVEGPLTLTPLSEVGP